MDVIWVRTCLRRQRIDGSTSKVRSVLAQRDTYTVSIEIGGHKIGETVFVQVDSSWKNWRDAEHIDIFPNGEVSRAVVVVNLNSAAVVVVRKQDIEISIVIEIA